MFIGDKEEYRKKMLEYKKVISQQCHLTCGTCKHSTAVPVSLTCKDATGSIDIDTKNMRSCEWVRRYKRNEEGAQGEKSLDNVQKLVTDVL